MRVVIAAAAALCAVAPPVRAADPAAPDATQPSEGVVELTIDAATGAVIVNGRSASAVRVHVESPVPVQLIRYYGVVSRVGNQVTTKHQLICGSPCDKDVDVTGAYPFYVTSPDIPDSKTFALSDESDAWTVRVTPGSSVGEWGGGAIAGLGVVAGVVGAVMFLPVDSETTFIAGVDNAVTGGVLLGAGAVALGGGFLWRWASETKTEVVPSAAPGAATRE